MKYVIRIVLLAIIIFLAYKMYRSIAEPMEYEAEVEKRERAIVKKLKHIREAQLAFKDENGRFTGSFDTLINFMQNGYLQVERLYGDKDDTTSKFVQILDSVSVKDSLFKGVDIPNIRYKPGTNNQVEFKIEAGTITRNDVRVPVFQVTDPEPFSKERQKEKNPLRVGDIYNVDYNGNWSKDL